MSAVVAIIPLMLPSAWPKSKQIPVWDHKSNIKHVVLTLPFFFVMHQLQELSANVHPVPQTSIRPNILWALVQVLSKLGGHHEDLY